MEENENPNGTTTTTAAADATPIEKAGGGAFPCGICERSFSRLASWTTHRRNKHGKPSKAERKAVIAIASGEPAAAAAGFKTFDSARAAAPATDDPPAGESRADKKLRETKLRDMQAKLERLKGSLAQSISRVMWQFLRQIPMLSGITITPDDETTVAESIENALGILNVNFEIQPYDITARSSLWVMLLPVIAVISTLAAKPGILEYVSQYNSRVDRTEGNGQDNPSSPPNTVN
jgi:hypothetical protein